MLARPADDFRGGNFVTPLNNFADMEGTGVGVDVGSSGGADEDGARGMQRIVGNGNGDGDAEGECSATAFTNQGDAVVFVSHKQHNVEPVTNGVRHVLVVELWEGAERGCGHRCEMATGACSYKTPASLISAHLDDFSEEDRAAAMRFLKKGGAAGSFL